MGAGRLLLSPDSTVLRGQAVAFGGAPEQISKVPFPFVSACWFRDCSGDSRQKGLPEAEGAI